MSKIRVALTHEQNKQLEALAVAGAKADVSQALTAVQAFIDQHEEDFINGELNIIALEATPKSHGGSAVAVFLFINLTDNIIVEMHGRGKVQVADFDVALDPVEWHFGAGFLGEFVPNSAIFVMQDAVLKGRPTKASYTFADLQLTLAEMKIKTADQ